MKNISFLLAICLFSSGVLFAQPLSGNYTIDPSQPVSATNYQNFTDLATDLNNLGVSADVTVNVKEGQYLERFNLTDIVGATAASTITVQADPSNVNPVELKGPGGNTTQGTVTFNATKYITLKNLVIGTESGTYTRLAYINGQIADMLFDGCIFNQDAGGTTSSYKAAIYATGVTGVGNGLMVKNCEINDASYGVYCYSSSSTQLPNFEVSNTELNNVYYYGIYTYYVERSILHDNVLNMSFSSITQYGLRIYNSTSNASSVDVQRNEINMNSTSSQYGMYCYYTGNTSEKSMIKNNFFHSKTAGSSSTRYGIYMYTPGNFDIDHNTFKIKDGSPTSSRNFYLSATSSTPAGYTPGNINFRNNILVNLNRGNNSSGALMYVSSVASSYFSNMSNNLYWTDGNATTPFFFGSSYTNYADFATASGDVNSVEGDPQFLSNTDLHVEGLLVDSRGTNLSTVLDDIDGDTRPLAPSTVVDIGADEFQLPPCPTPVNFRFIEGDTSSAIFEWLSANATEWEFEYGPTGFTPGTGTTVVANSNPDTIHGLNSREFFEVYVRSVCGVGDSSNRQGPIIMNTHAQGQYLDFDTECGPGFVDIGDSVPDLFLPYSGEVGFGLQVPILFQGEVVDRLTVGLNGGILFNTTSGNVNSTINGSSPNGSGWFPFNQLLDDDLGGVHFFIKGQAPNRQVIIQWDSVPDYPGSTNPDPGTFQVLYEEATTEFYFNYLDVDFGTSNATDGGDAEIGVRGPNQDVTVSSNNTTFLSQNTCIHWYYTDCPKPRNLIQAYLYSEEVAYTWSAGIANETEWTVVYGPTGFDPSVGGTSFTVTDPQIIIPGLMENTEYDIYVFANCDVNTMSDGLMGTFTTPSHCAAPTNVTTNAFVDSFISDWTWNPNNFNPTYELTGFNIYHGEVGFDPFQAGTQTMDDDQFGDTIYDNTMLTGGVYEMYIEATCLNNYNSDRIGPFRFVVPITNESPCDALQLPVDNVARRFDNDGATATADEQGIVPPVTGPRRTDGWDNNDLDHSTWFKFIAPNSGQIRILSTDAGFDGQMAVYETNDCSDVPNMTLVAANDNEIDGLSLAPNFTICGLTPGQEYYVMHDSYDGTQTGEYSIRMYEITFEAGTPGPTQDICTSDTVNLFSGISGYTQGGTWIDTYGTFQVQNDSMFHTDAVAYQEYFFEYRFEDGCAMDSAVFQLNVHPPSYAGEDAEHVVCKNEPYNLFQGLGGLVDHGGIWYDYQSDVMAEGEVTALTLNLPGTYNYKYVVNNGYCPNDTVDILITVDMTCDYLAVTENFTESFKVYPNPTNGKVIIESEALENGSIELLDAKGALIKAIELNPVNSRQEIDMSAYANGMYLLKLSLGEEFSITRLIKQ